MIGFSKTHKKRPWPARAASISIRLRWACLCEIARALRVQVELFRLDRQRDLLEQATHEALEHPKIRAQARSLGVFFLIFCACASAPYPDWMSYGNLATYECIAPTRMAKGKVNHGEDTPTRTAMATAEPPIMPPDPAGFPGSPPMSETPMLLSSTGRFDASNCDADGCFDDCESGFASARFSPAHAVRFIFGFIAFLLGAMAAQGFWQSMASQRAANAKVLGSIAKNFHQAESRHRLQRTLQSRWSARIARLSDASRLFRPEWLKKLPIEKVD